MVDSAMFYLVGTLGEPYSDPAADVRGFIAQAKSQNA